MDAIECILTRRSVREYSQKAVPEEVVRQLLEAAMQAPSAGNQQPWHFVIITQRDILAALAGALRNGKMLKDAPLGIAVCADLNALPHAGFWVQDCSAAAQNLLLAAHALGLGGVWLGVYPIEERVKFLQSSLALPAQVIPLCVVSLGYPAAAPEAPEARYDPARVHANYW